MKSVSLLVVSVAVLSASSVEAQQRIEITRPDTLGANFDVTKVGTGTPSDFDFLIGTWNYRFQSRKQDNPAEYGLPRPGIWTAAKTHGDFMVEDEFRTEIQDGTRTLTMTYRVFNPGKKVWNVQGIGSRRSGWAPGVAWSDGQNRYLVQDYPEIGAKMRIKYYAITRDHFLWRADGSQDGGKTWIPDVWLIEAKRITP
jgi:hypothetical protein